MIITNIILFLFFIIFVLLAGLFAGSETGIYQLSRLRLRLGIERKKLSFILLGKTLHDSGCLLISLLLGTNLCHYLATSTITYLVLLNKEGQAGIEFIATLITTPVLFVFAELIPKNLFYYRADHIMPRISFLIYAFERVIHLSGIVYVLKFLNLLTSGFKRPTAIKKNALLTEAEFQTILHETNEEGILSTTQSEMMRRLGHISHLMIGTSMIEISDAIVINIKSTKEDLIEICRQNPYTRYPVYEGQINNIVGYVNIYKCLNSKNQFVDLKDFIKPIHRTPLTTMILSAIESMQSTGDEILLVTQTIRGVKPVGIVTMKDLVEELLGELAEW